MGVVIPRDYGRCPELQMIVPICIATGDLREAPIV
jgi:hypothetical protein